MMVDMARQGFGKNSLLGGRITELLRIRSAQLGECQPCMQSRKHDSISDEDVACLIAPGHGGDLTDQERLAVEFLDLLSADHHAIDDETYRKLGEVFTSAQIVELGFACANAMGLHRFLHTLDLYGTGEPVIPYSADQVDSAKPDTRCRPRHEPDGPGDRRHRTGRRQHLQAVDRAGRPRARPRPGDRGHGTARCARCRGGHR